MFSTYPNRLRLKQKTSTNIKYTYLLIYIKQTMLIGFICEMYISKRLVIIF